MSETYKSEKIRPGCESDVRQALEYIGVETCDFNLKNSMFTRPKHSIIHGIGHIYRVMIGCALLGRLVQKPREALLAFCGAYIHDLARCNDGIDFEHGANAVLKHFEHFNHIWDKYRLTPQERDQVKEAVIQHSICEYFKPGDSGYDVMAMLKDADALDRCRIGDLAPDMLRYAESRELITVIKDICFKTLRVNNDIDLDDFLTKL
ncbi:MAG: hypothetical protein IKV29_04200 [Alistipes sp.]|nr:hypothetical protein [Alistipes sp.]